MQNCQYIKTEISASSKPIPINHTNAKLANAFFLDYKKNIFQNKQQIEL